MTYSVWDFFRNGGGQAVVVRLFSPLFADEAARLAQEALVTAQAQAAAAALIAAAQTAAALAGAVPASVMAAVNAVVPAGAGVDRDVDLLIAAQGQAVAATAATAGSVAAAARAAVPAVGAPGPEALNAANAAAAAGEAAALVAGANAAAVRDAVAQVAADAAAAWAGADAVATDAEAAEREPAVADAAALQVRANGVAAGRPAGPDQVAAVEVAAAAVGADKAAAAQAARAAAGPYQLADVAATAVRDAAIAEHDRVVAAAVSAAIVAAQPAAVNQVVAAQSQAPDARIVADTLTLHAASPGTWGNSLRVRITHDDPASFPATDAHRNERFSLAVRDGVTGKVETHRRLTVQLDDPRTVQDVLRNESALVRLPNAAAAWPAAHGAAPRGEEFTTPGAYSAAGTLASDGQVLVRGDYDGNQANKTGIYALERADLFNLLVIPPPQLGVDLDPQVWVTAAAYCQRRRAFLLMDPPVAWTSTASARAGLAGLAGLIGARSHAAIFFPMLRRPDPLRGDQVRDFAPSGAVAGVFARTDAGRGVWKAPAGLEATLAGIPELSVSLTDAENGELNPMALNCLRALPAAGRVVWGARTLDGDDRLASDWKYIPVRRLALFIEESLYRGTQWVVFEGNDEKLWSQIRLNLGAFMHTLFRQGAFQGTSPRDAYFVKCDAETTVQTDINQGIVNIVVGFAPLKPAEFVVIKIQQIAGQIPT